MRDPGEDSVKSDDPRLAEHHAPICRCKPLCKPRRAFAWADGQVYTHALTSPYRGAHSPTQPCPQAQPCKHLHTRPNSRQKAPEGSRIDFHALDVYLPTYAQKIVREAPARSERDAAKSPVWTSAQSPVIRQGKLCSGSRLLILRSHLHPHPVI